MRGVTARRSRVGFSRRSLGGSESDVNDNTLAILVKGCARDGQRDNLFAVYQQIAAPRATVNDAMPVVMWIADNADENLFYLIEVYPDPLRLEQDMKQEWLTGYRARMRELMAGEFEVIFGTLRWAKGMPSNIADLKPPRP